ncbi:hypothetical protein F4604DRAFT_1679057 [Suillus subluteus]|nr:hypothetical protein F4604DRAFT_1679057 [Suillus subluteus]
MAWRMYDYVTIERSNVNPSLLPDTSQLGLREEYTKPPHSFNNLSAMIGEHEEGDGDRDEDEDEDGDWDGDGDEEEGEGEDEAYEDNGPSREHDPGAPQHYQPLPYYPDYAPFAQMSDVATFDNLIPAAIRELEPIMRSRFSSIERMRGERLERQRTRCSAQAGINIPGIRRVFVYSPRRHPAETQRGQVIMTGVIRPTNEVSITVAVPSQRQLPPPASVPLVSPPTRDPGPVPQELTDDNMKNVWKEAKVIMCRKVLYGNAMCVMERNVELAEEAFLEAMRHVVLDILLTASQIPNRVKFCKKLTTIMTTVRGVFKKEARRVLPNHYSLTPEGSDAGSLSNHREAVVPPLLVNQTYLFRDSTIMSPVDHPAVIDTIYHSLWMSSQLYEVLNFNELDDFDDLFSIGGAAIHNTLLEFQEGIYKPVQFSPLSSSATEYRAIQTHNAIVRNTPALRSAALSIKQDMIARGTSLRAR